MIKLKSDSQVQEVKVNKTPDHTPASIRPQVVDAKVYKLKSAFVKNSVFITLGYITENDTLRPVEIFINSKDLTKTPEYVVLTRLISAIFRRSGDPMFILEELQGIFDPNGGSFREGKYYHSFYSEVADVIETFFCDVGIIEKPSKNPIQDNGVVENNIKPEEVNFEEQNNNIFRICPTCSSKSLKTENGCDSCVECGYSKCDK
tara:strand:- start:422 stop:1033 length:612 start_codon:yes stop_codon:yes gene_type:complete